MLFEIGFCNRMYQNCVLLWFFIAVSRPFVEDRSHTEYGITNICIILVKSLYLPKNHAKINRILIRKVISQMSLMTCLHEYVAMVWNKYISIKKPFFDVHLLRCYRLAFHIVFLANTLVSSLTNSVLNLCAVLRKFCDGNFEPKQAVST